MEKYAEKREEILERQRTNREKNKEAINAKRRERRRRAKERRINEQSSTDGKACP